MHAWPDCLLLSGIAGLGGCMAVPANSSPAEPAVVDVVPARVVVVYQDDLSSCAVTSASVARGLTAMLVEAARVSAEG